ncbi:MAG: hypothetical protein EOP22_00080 [Hyphomicrobiales bacterium]|nr:MAG: hypothetical protein EOP22_00080 [Hyphomicrobiales bacterium]
MRFILAALRLLSALLILATALPALLALGGFAVPLFDLFNHLQLFLFFGTLLAAVAALLLSMRPGWKIVALLGFAASAWIFVPEWLSSLAPRQVVSDVQIVRVMTHNLYGQRYDLERLRAVIREEDPDILALQEFSANQSGLAQMLRDRYPYSVRCRGGSRANLGLYSKFPFETEMGPADCPANARGSQRIAHILVSFKLSSGTAFSLLTTHMDWPYPIERQREQFDAAIETVRNVKGPLLVVGDFNSTPWSYALQRFAAETGLKRETRNLMTYPELVPVRRRVLQLEPFLPLDHVFQRGMIVSELHRSAATGSDHLPVVFTFSVAP